MCHVRRDGRTPDKANPLRGGHGCSDRIHGDTRLSMISSTTEARWSGFRHADRRERVPHTSNTAFPPDVWESLQWRRGRHHVRGLVAVPRRQTIQPWLDGTIAVDAGSSVGMGQWRAALRQVVMRWTRYGPATTVAEAHRPWAATPERRHVYDRSCSAGRRRDLSGGSGMREFRWSRATARDAAELGKPAGGGIGEPGRHVVAPEIDAVAQCDVRRTALGRSVCSAGRADQGCTRRHRYRVVRRERFTVDSGLALHLPRPVSCLGVGLRFGAARYPAQPHGEWQ